MSKIETLKKIIGKIETTQKTHMSVLYIGKKKVAKELIDRNFGFIDLRPIETRRNIAVRMVEIDAAYCEDLQSTPVEIERMIMVIMRRFDSSNDLDKLYDQGKITKEHATQIGALFANAHKKTRTSEQISEIGYKAILGNWEELFAVTKDSAKAIGRTISERNYQKIIHKIRKFILVNKDYMEMRKNNGFIRQCHGDGHAENMFVEDGIIKIFDGMGFKAEYSYADVISDIAFAIMDALARKRLDIAEEIRTSYVEESGDTEGMKRLLNFYICYRAFVRGQVSTMISNGMEGEEKEKMLKAAKRYYSLAIRYLSNIDEFSVVPKGQHIPE